MNLSNLKTPSLVLDLVRVKRNAARMNDIVRIFGVRLRPHIKTHKCIEVARIQIAKHSGGITVSTLAEARAFLAHGFTDITYAVPIEPGKFAEAITLSRQCERLALITADPDIPAPLNHAASRAGLTLHVFLEVDCGDARGGVRPDSPEALKVPLAITAAPNLHFAGILTHAG